MAANSNSRGIPKADFIDDVAGFVAKNPVEQSLKKMDELYSKYKLMEGSLVQKRGALKNKIPEIKKTLEMLKFINEKKDNGESTVTNFMLAENLYANATLKEGNTCYLWLGANVMLEYTFEEAIALLEKNHKGAVEQLKSLEEDIAFLRDQITTTEVSMARVHNYDVKIRRNKKPDN
eukprot:TRINITY_DN1457_c0_g1::TRINITY_DN1457_c0_g1_i1::g.27143::m.27143 TRINITY_DN1457_c0_g1::TRINITY_DN1457_c0_g1_i1::g.27143  ORF type:complete len:188 (+),score=62.81,sp/Q5RCG9/PFD3_PONAB/53.26/2e-54,Prefoldin/PF02996.12/1.6e-29,Prefoldin_2/PF01920.15/19,Prefoldin_2/PF01920.15/0.026,Syntaxin-6_N/PF09177.6/0.38,Syntaxin-6_N/PF09177.6/79 TRINITY_DN1457_c0_g1_i1:34-564(+)